MKFSEVKGDLFGEEPTSALAHCISEDVAMGKGIAVLFKNKFGGVAELKGQVAAGAKTGRVACLNRDSRFIYYLITKVGAYDKPTYESLQSSLISMCEHAEKNGVSAIAMPKIGCGLDGLKWDQVKAIIQEVFHNTNIKITVYYL